MLAFIRSIKFTPFQSVCIIFICIGLLMIMYSNEIVRFRVRFITRRSVKRFIKLYESTNTTIASYTNYLRDINITYTRCKEMDEAQLLGKEIEDKTITYPDGKKFSGLSAIDDPSLSLSMRSDMQTHCKIMENITKEYIESKQKSLVEIKEIMQNILHYYQDLYGNDDFYNKMYDKVKMYL